MLRVRLAFLVTSVVCAAGSMGCAGACKRVAADRADFERRTARAEQPHLRVSVPFDVIAVLMASELRELKSFNVPLPAVSGVSLGSVRGGVEQIQLTPAPAGQVGFVVKVVLRAGKKEVLEVELDARTTPRIDLERGTVTVALSADDVRRVRPRLGPGARKTLRDYVWSELPNSVRTLVSKKQIDALLGGLTDQVLGEVAEAMRRDLASQIGEVARFEIDLPDLPLAALAVGSEAGALTLTARTSLPVTHGVAAKPRHGSTHQNAVELRMSGEVAAELGNWAIDRGQIPERYGLDGQADPNGDLLAGLAWRRGEPKPLVVHLWTAEGSELARKKQCAHVEVRATPAVAAKAGELQISTSDARVDEVEGSAKVRAGVFFSGVGRRSFEFVETIAGTFELDIGDAPVTATVHSASVDGDDVVFGLLVRRPAPAGSRRPNPGRPSR